MGPGAPPVPHTMQEGRSHLYNGKKPLLSADTSLTAQWAQDLNGDTTPDDVHLGKTSSKYWWRCPKDARHVWQAPIKARAEGSGCAVCAGTQIVVGVNDLATVAPGLASEWCFALNGDVTPQDVTAGSNRVVYWTCANSEHPPYENMIKRRVSGATCTRCKDEARRSKPGYKERKPQPAGVVPPRVKRIEEMRTRLGDGYRSMPLSADEALTAQWAQDLNGDTTPDDVHLGKTTPKYWWRCPKDARHVWQAPVSQRTDGQGCGVCAGKRVVPGVNDLASQEPDVAAEWDTARNGDLTATRVTAASAKTAWWRCPAGHAYQAPIKNRTLRGLGCTVCSGNQVMAGVNDLATVRPDLVAQWSEHQPSGIRPQDVTQFSHAVVNWDCPRGHHWAMSVAKRSGGTGCNVCTGKVVWPGFNDLASKRPDVARNWHPTLNGELTASAVAAGSNKRVWWLCDAGHATQATVDGRTSGGNGCYKCSVLGASHLEADLADVIELLVPGQRVVRSHRGLLGDRREVDIYLPDMGVAIEFNGVAWHSEKFGRDSEYHASKSTDAVKKSVRLIHVWEDDWLDRRNIVIRSIAHRLGATCRLPDALPVLPPYLYDRAGARSLRVTQVASAEARAFLDLNHIQGGAVGSLCLGLLDREGRTRAVLVVKTRGKSAPGDWEIVRYATAGVVPGGFTRLLAHAEKDLAGKVHRWITFADLAISDGSMYESTGFVADGTIAPDYSYAGSFTNWRREHKFNFRLKRFRTDPDLVWRDGLTERELAALNGLHRVWDAGKVRYIRRAC